MALAVLDELAADLRRLLAAGAAAAADTGLRRRANAPRPQAASVPALAPELRAGLDLRGKAADGRRLLALAHLDRRAGRELCRAALREGTPVVRAAALRGLALAAPGEAEREAVAALSGPAPVPLKRV